MATFVLLKVIDGDAGHVEVAAVMPNELASAKEDDLIQRGAGTTGPYVALRTDNLKPKTATMQAVLG